MKSGTPLIIYKSLQVGIYFSWDRYLLAVAYWVGKGAIIVRDFEYDLLTILRAPFMPKRSWWYPSRAWCINFWEGKFFLEVAFVLSGWFFMQIVLTSNAWLDVCSACADSAALTIKSYSDQVFWILVHRGVHLLPPSVISEVSRSNCNKYRFNLFSPFVRHAVLYSTHNVMCRGKILAFSGRRNAIGSNFDYAVKTWELVGCKGARKRFVETMWWSHWRVCCKCY